MEKQIDLVNNVCQLCDGTEFGSVEKEAEYELLKCKRCGLISGYAYSIQSNYNAEYAEGGDYHIKFEIARRIGRGERVHLPYGPRKFFSKVVSGDRNKILDIGCGGGAFLLQALQRGFDVHGIDVSENAVAFIRRELGLKANAGTIDTVLKQKQEFLDFFNFVTAFEVIEHVQNIMDFLLSVKHTLKLGGELFLSTPNFNSIYYQNSKGRLNRPPIHITFWNHSTIEKAR